MMPKNKPRSEKSFKLFYVFVALWLAFLLTGGALLGISIYPYLDVYVFHANKRYEVPEWFPIAGLAFLGLSVLSYYLAGYYLAEAAEERARECAIRQYSEIIAEIRQLREKLEKTGKL